MSFTAPYGVQTLRMSKPNVPRPSSGAVSPSPSNASTVSVNVPPPPHSPSPRDQPLPPPPVPLGVLLSSAVQHTPMRVSVVAVFAGNVSVQAELASERAAAIGADGCWIPFSPTFSEDDDGKAEAERERLVVLTSDSLFAFDRNADSVQAARAVLVLSKEAVARIDGNFLLVKQAHSSAWAWKLQPLLMNDEGNLETRENQSSSALFAALNEWMLCVCSVINKLRLLAARTRNRTGGNSSKPLALHNTRNTLSIPPSLASVSRSKSLSVRSAPSPSHLRIFPPTPVSPSTPTPTADNDSPLLSPNIRYLRAEGDDTHSGRSPRPASTSSDPNAAPRSTSSLSAESTPSATEPARDPTSTTAETGNRHSPIPYTEVTFAITSSAYPSPLARLLSKTASSLSRSGDSGAIRDSGSPRGSIELVRTPSTSSKATSTLLANTGNGTFRNRRTSVLPGLLSTVVSMKRSRTFGAK
ncbi:hypothetical protein BC830DRAFT_1113446 [Chytriomyces sp. MP71]|nr:hypothetical protein BC830DRAFT_1113446 [Chytriomyces sp. MP71]